MSNKCPVCNKASNDKYKPFCSKRCSDIDLGKWLNGSYVIEGDEYISIENDDISEV